MTLVELMVAIVTGLIVVLAAYALLDFSSKTVRGTTDRIDSAANGSNALTVITQELESSCVYPQASPIQATLTSPPVTSNAQSLVFWSSPGGASGISGPTSTLALHDIQLQANGELTDTVYSLTGGSSPTNWSFAATAQSSTKLATRVSAVVANGQAQPVFRYLGYDVNGGITQNLAGANGTLSATAAQQVVEVAIDFSVAPYSGATNAGSQSAQTGSVVLRLSPDTPGGSATVNAPCS